MIRKIVEDLMKPSATGESVKGIYLGHEEYHMLLNDAEIKNYKQPGVQEGENFTIHGIPVFEVNTFHHYNVG
jgi:hypothetical protein